MTVTVSVYTLSGSPVWSQTETGRSDIVPDPASDLEPDRQRRPRVERGIYVYRATISSGNDNYSTASRKLAVAAF